MKAASLLFFFLALLMMAPLSRAQDIQSQIDRRQREIYRGYTLCDLSAGEAKDLQNDLDRIREEYEQMSSGGSLGTSEREALAGELNRNSARLSWDMQNQERCVVK